LFTAFENANSCCSAVWNYFFAFSSCDEAVVRNCSAEIMQIVIVISAYVSHCADRGRDRRDGYREFDRGRHDKFSPIRHDVSPPQMKRMRRDWYRFSLHFIFLCAGKQTA